MRKNTRLLVALLAFGLITVSATRRAIAQAQTLVPGDVAIVGFWADGGQTAPLEAFAFVALTAIDVTDPVTVISFTDNGWTGSAFTTNEGTATTFPVDSALAAGDVVTVSPTGLAFSTSGDQLFAFTGTLAAPTHVYGFNNDGLTWAGDTSTSSRSALPNDLIGANVAMNNASEMDNCSYDPAAGTSGSHAYLLGLINNPANWTCNDDHPGPDFPTSFTVLAPGSVSLIDFSASRVAAGVELAWRTGSELDCGAFALLRCDLSGDCAEVANHDELGISVPCEDSPVGAEYAALDQGADDLTAYSYYLREYETTGGINNYGPIVVDVAAATQDDGVTPPAAGADGEAGGCAISNRQSGGSAASLMVLLLGALIIRRRRQS